MPAWRSAAGSEWETAAAHFSTALEQSEKLTHVVERAHTQRFFAQMLLRRDAAGARNAALALLAEASEAYRRMGCPGTGRWSKR